MKTLLAFVVVALAFTTGFTCSKNSPETAAPATTTEAPPAQDQMVAPSPETSQAPGAQPEAPSTTAPTN